MPADTDELAALRAELAELRRDLDRALTRLDLPNSRDRTEGDSEWANMEFNQLSVRHSRQQIPLLLHSGTDESGVFLYDAQPQVRGRFRIGADGLARLEILNEAGNVVVWIGEGEGGRGEIRVHEADGTPRAGLKANVLGGVVSVVDARGMTLATMLGTADGGHLFICTAQGKPAVTLKALPEGGALILAEPGGQVMGSFIVTSQGAVLSVYGEHGMPALTLSGLGELGGTLVFFTRDGELNTVLP